MKRIGRFFLRLGLRARLMLVIGILAFVLTAGSIAAFSYAIEFTEDHLVSENQYYSLRGYIDSDIAHGKAPRLLPNKKLYADPSVVNGVKLEPIPPEFQNLPDGYTEYEDDHQADYVFRMQRHGVTYILTTDQTEFEEVEHSLVAVVVLFGLLAVMAAVLMAWLLGGTVVRPVKKLAREVQRCASEKEFRPLSVELTNDEVGYLAKTCENSLRKLHETVQSERFFASDLSHEFRTHLSIVSTTAELMREIGDLTPQQERQLAKITLAAERMQRLIHVLLALARDKDVKAADNDIKYLPDIAREIQEEDEPDARQKGLRMVIDDRSGTPPPRLSDSFASCVLSNLVRNAVRNSTRGTITITLEPTRFSVKDEGCGIPKDEMEKIFLPFTRGNFPMVRVTESGSRWSPVSAHGWGGKFRWKVKRGRDRSSPLRSLRRKLRSETLAQPEMILTMIFPSIKRPKARKKNPPIRFTQRSPRFPVRRWRAYAAAAAYPAWITTSVSA